MPLREVLRRGLLWGIVAVFTSVTVLFPGLPSIGVALATLAAAAVFVPALNPSATADDLVRTVEKVLQPAPAGLWRREPAR